MKIKLYTYQIILALFTFIYYIYNFLYIKIYIIKKLDPLISIIRRGHGLGPGTVTPLVPLITGPDHGFHVPVSGVIEKFGDVSGSLYTVLGQKNS